MLYHWTVYVHERLANSSVWQSPDISFYSNCEQSFVYTADVKESFVLLTLLYDCWRFWVIARAVCVTSYRTAPVVLLFMQ